MADPVLVREERHPPTHGAEIEAEVVVELDVEVQLRPSGNRLAERADEVLPVLGGRDVPGCWKPAAVRQVAMRSTMSSGCAPSFRPGRRKSVRAGDPRHERSSVPGPYRTDTAGPSVRMTSLWPGDAWSIEAALPRLIATDMFP